MRNLAFFQTFVLVCMMCLWVSCGDDNEALVPEVEKEEEAVVTCSVENIAFDSNDGNYALSFSTNKSWAIKVLGNVTWCKVNSLSGSAGTHSVNVSVEKNNTYVERDVTLAILCEDKSHTIVVTQEQQDVFILSQEENSPIEVDSNGGKIEIAVKTNVDYEIEIVNDAAQWIKEVTSRSLSSYSHVFSIESNENISTRRGVINFKTLEHNYAVKIEQKGTQDAPVLVVNKKEYVVSALGETITVEVQSNVDFEQSISNVDWINLAEDNRGLLKHTLKYVVLPNDTYDERSAEIVVYDEKSNLKETIRIIQAQKDALFLMKNEVEISQEGGEFSIELNANVEYRIEVPQNAQSWLNIVNSRSLNVYTHKFIAAANNAYEDRSAKIVFKDLNGKFSDVLEVKQKQKDLLLVSRKHYELSAKKDTFEVEVEANIGFEVQINVDWIKLIKQATGSNRKQTLYFEVEDNLKQQDRKGQIVIANKEKAMEETIEVLQKKKDQGASEEKNPDGNVDDMIWG